MEHKYIDHWTKSSFQSDYNELELEVSFYLEILSYKNYIILSLQMLWNIEIFQKFFN